MSRGSWRDAGGAAGRWPDGVSFGVTMAVCLLALGLATAAPAPGADGDAGRLQAMAEEIARLRAEVAELRAEGQRARDERLGEIERRLDVFAAELERQRLGEAAPRADRSEHGLGAGASKVYQAAAGTTLGGYGEVVYQGFAGGGPEGRDRLDIQRVVLYAGHKFDDRWLFNSEIEFEHGTTDDAGEISVELAYVDYLGRPALNARAGLLLVPMGFVNELHEPTAFLGVQRPDVERFILPSTWRENGFGLFGSAGPVSYRTYVVTGLDAAGFSAAGGLRDGRQNGSESLAEDFAWVGRLDYSPRPGLLLGGSAYLGDSGQGLVGTDGRPLGVSTRLAEVHFEWRSRGWQARALGARARVGEAAELAAALDLAPAEAIGSELGGYYLELGYDLLAGGARGRRLIPFARWESYDTQRRVPRGFLRDPATAVDVLTLGLSFKPFEQVVVKADYQDYDNAAGSAVDRFHVALGWVF